MTEQRWQELENDPTDNARLTPSEIEEGWHWCAEFDCLLVGPGMGELRFCSCLPKEHKVYMTIPPEETGTIDL